MEEHRKLGNVAVVVVYVYWEQHYAERFANCLRAFPAGYPHTLLVVCNDMKVDDSKRKTFFDIPCVFIQGDNVGMDIGAYQQIADQIACDFMVCFGSSTYLKRAGWLNRMVQAYRKYGLALYGAMGNRGVIAYGVWPHIRSTAFWFPPALLKAYPKRVLSHADRYPFEHGEGCFTEWVRSKGLKALVVNWSGEHEWAMWNSSPEGYMRGKQSDMLAGDRLSEPPVYRFA